MCFHSTRQVPVVKQVLCSDSFRQRIMFTQFRSVLFLIYDAYRRRKRAEPCYSWLPICTLLCEARLLTNGPEEKSKESPVRASQCCAAAWILGNIVCVCVRGQFTTKRKPQRISPGNRHSINLCQNNLLTRRWRSRCVWKWVVFFRKKEKDGFHGESLSLKIMDQCTIETPSTTASFRVLSNCYPGPTGYDPGKERQREKVEKETSCLAREWKKAWIAEELPEE